MIKKRVCLIIVILSLIVFPLQINAAMDDKGNQQVILVIADFLQETDLSRDATPNLYRLGEQGAIGLMNVNAKVDWNRIEGKGLTTIRWERNQQSMASIDQMAMWFLSQASEKTKVIILSPRTRSDGEKGELAPVLAAGGGIPPGSLFTSGSTRREGIITNEDVWKSIADFLHNRSFEESGGKGLQTVTPKNGNWHLFHQVAIKTKDTYEKRPFVLRIYGTVAGSLFLFMAGVLLKKKWQVRRVGLGKGYSIMRNLCNWSGTAVLLTPLVFLLFPVLEKLTKQQLIFDNWAWIAIITALIGGITWVFMQIPSILYRLLILSIVMVIVIVTDTGLGGELAHESIMSYDPIVGARYYGVGNEYMALLISCFLLMCGYLLTLFPHWEKWGKWIFPVLGFALIWFFAAPGLGTNAGGTITAAVSVAIPTVYLFKLPKGVRGMVGIAFLAVSQTLMLILHQNIKSPTHVSQGIDLIMNSQNQEIYSLILRKLLMNWRLMHVTAAVPFFLGILLLVGWATIFPVPRITSLLFPTTELKPFLKGGIAGALAGFVVNDSGISVAVLFFLPILYTVCLINLNAIVPTPHTIAPNVVLQPDRPDWSQEPGSGH